MEPEKITVSMQEFMKALEELKNKKSKATENFIPVKGLSEKERRARRKERKKKSPG